MAGLREQLDESQIHESIRERIRTWNLDVVSQVREAVAQHPVVVVGMAQNPHVKKARTLLTNAEIPFEYIEFGSYLSAWRTRLALKMWTGWATFPMVFVNGVLIGGAADLEARLTAGDLGVGAAPTPT